VAHRAFHGVVPALVTPFCSGERIGCGAWAAAGVDGFLVADATLNGSANVAPKLYVDLYRAFRANRLDEAARLQALATKLGATVSLHTSPSMMKDALSFIGLPAGNCRTPLGPVPQEARAQLDACWNGWRAKTCW